jgi:hypothetical protein
MSRIDGRMVEVNLADRECVGTIVATNVRLEVLLRQVLERF